MQILTTVLAVLLVSAGTSAAQTEQASEPATASPDASRGGGQGLFSGSFADAVWTVAAFVAVLVILGKVAWKPMVARLKEREQHIQQQIDSANNARRQAEKLLDEYKQQGTKIIQDAADFAQQRQEELLERAGKEVLSLRQKAQADIEYARVAALEKLWTDATDIVSGLCQEVLGRTVTAEDNKRLMQDAIKRIGPFDSTQSRRQPDGDRQI